MQFDELIKEIKNVLFVTVREEASDYFEAVISKGELENLYARLEKFFGSCLWPSSETLSDEVEISIKEFGGIMPGQTLYFNKHDNETAIAMLWPWSNGMYITVKVANIVKTQGEALP